MPDKLIDVVPPIITKLGDIRLDTSPRLERRFSDGACRGLILIVDDQADVRYLFEQVLRRSGYFVRTCSRPSSKRQREKRDSPAMARSSMAARWLSSIRSFFR